MSLGRGLITHRSLLITRCFNVRRFPMANPSWQISGQYFETCSCDYLCPCIITGLSRSTHGDCYFALAYQIDRGHFGTVSLDGLNFVVAAYSPETMDKGNWKVGLIAD